MGMFLPDSVRLYCGDCCAGLQQLDSSSLGLVVTSPPYFNARDYSHWPSYSAYLSWLRDVFALVHSRLQDGRFCCVNVSPVISARSCRSDESVRYPIPFDLVPIMRDIGFKFIDDIVWVKPDGSAPNRNGGFYRNRKPLAYKPNVVTEYILVFRKDSGILVDDVLRSVSKDIIDRSLVRDVYERTNVWEFQPETGSAHPAPFPLGLPMRLVSYYSLVGDVVCDPFMGSGTTGVACLQQGRCFVGMELVPSYFHMAVDRLEDVSFNLGLL